MLSVGILSHFAPHTLEKTLISYKKHGLFELSDDIFAVLQLSNRQEEEKIICDKFNVRSICLDDNGRMGSGFKAIYENARHEYILFLENDFEINEENETKEFIENSMYFIKEMNVDVVRGRSRKNPGEPNFALHVKNLSSHLSECIYYIDDPEIIHPTKIYRIKPKIGDKKWYTSTSEFCNYTNNPYICSKIFFEKTVLPYCIFGCNIENDLTYIWSKNTYKCVYGPGLFTHYRLDGHS
jgi:glycosyltransferase involved in cell wall biosynthesis